MTDMFQYNLCQKNIITALHCTKEKKHECSNICKAGMIEKCCEGTKKSNCFVYCKANPDECRMLISLPLNF